MGCAELRIGRSVHLISVLGLTNPEVDVSGGEGGDIVVTDLHICRCNNSHVRICNTVHDASLFGIFYCFVDVLPYFADCLPISGLSSAMTSA